MELPEAIQLVLELADSAVLSDNEARDAGLTAEQARQNEAVETVAKWARHALGVRY